jgi:tRNA A-37 threonylcarbamoyl transferase component Bud32
MLVFELQDDIKNATYAIFATALATSLAILGWQAYVRHLLRHDKPPPYKFLKPFTRVLLLPIYELLLWVNAVVTLIGLAMVKSTSRAAAYLTSFVILLYALNPLFIVYTRSMPRTTLSVVRQLAFSMLLDMLVVVPENAFAEDSALRAWASFTVVLILIVIIVAMLFVPNPRTKTLAVRVHTTIVAVFAVFALVLVFYAAKKVIIVGPQGEVSVGFAVSVLVWVCFWACSVFSSMTVMYSDTLYWHHMYHNDKILNDILDMRVTPMLDARLQSLVREHSNIFIEFGALRVQRLVASGANSDVYVARYKGASVALKVFKPLEITYEVVQRWSREISISIVLDHPNIVKCHGISIAPPKIIIVSEFVELSLDRFIRDVKPDFSTALDIMIDVASAVAYLHERKLIHRDIKAANVVLVDAAGKYCAKLIDFGETRNIEGETAAMTITGTPQYVAPELLRTHGDGTATYGRKADVFSMAILFWEILHHGTPVFPERWSIASILSAVIGGYRPQVDDQLRVQHEPIAELVQDMWSAEDGVRPNAAAVHDFLIRYRDGL